MGRNELWKKYKFWNICYIIVFDWQEWYIVNSLTFCFVSEIFNYCDSNPCSFNGECLGGIGGYNCKCKSGFKGLNCEESKTFIQSCIHPYDL